VTPLPTPLTPDAVMARIAAALPADCRQDVIVVGSLAAGYHFFAGDGQRGIRTKDVDCMFCAACACRGRRLRGHGTPAGRRLATANGGRVGQAGRQRALPMTGCR
jgi:hypothetical protein